jgi:hypothetical protein
VCLLTLISKVKLNRTASPRAQNVRCQHPVCKDSGWWTPRHRQGCYFVIALHLAQHYPLNIFSCTHNATISKSNEYSYRWRDSHSEASIPSIIFISPVACIDLSGSYGLLISETDCLNDSHPKIEIQVTICICKVRPLTSVTKPFVTTSLVKPCRLCVYSKPSLIRINWEEGSSRLSDNLV